MLTPREKSPLPENVPRGGSNLRHCGQRAQALPTELFRPPYVHVFCACTCACICLCICSVCLSLSVSLPACLPACLPVCRSVGVQIKTRSRQTGRHHVYMLKTNASALVVCTLKAGKPLTKGGRDRYALKGLVQWIRRH